MYARFGQELYARETIAAAAIIAVHREETEGRDLTARIADILPHASPTTRRRVANKLLQRMTAGAVPAVEEEEQTPVVSSALLRQRIASDDRTAVFARLLSRLPDTQARRELVYYATARADELVGAIARNVLYPYFIEDRIPVPYTEDEFISLNANLLLAPEPILTTGFVTDFARRVWNFESERTVCLALRILRQAGLLLPSPLLGERGRVHAYTLAPHGLSLPALLWGLYDEFGQDAVSPTWDQVCRARFARLFVVPASVVASRIWEAERAGLVGFWSGGGARRIVLKVREPDALVRLLLSGPEIK